MSGKGTYSRECNYSVPSQTVEGNEDCFVCKLKVLIDDGPPSAETLCNGMSNSTCLEPHSKKAYLVVAWDALDERFSGLLRKDRTHLELQEEIRLRSYVSTDQEQEDKARLFGIIVHRERSISQGHYFAYVVFGMQWYMIDDLTILKVPWESINDCMDQPYMLFYKTLPRPYID